MRTNSLSFGQIGLATALALMVSGCASYGSFDENEPGLEESILGPVIGVAAIGIAEEEEEIEYSARAPLVAPPDSNALPAPQTQASVTADPNWPTGSRERMAQVLSSEDQTLVYTPGIDGVDIAATQALAERSRAPVVADNGDSSRLLMPSEIEQERQVYIARAEANAARDAAAAVRGRRFLTDPPVSARTPSPEAPYGVEAEEVAEAEEGGFSWWPF